MQRARDKTVGVYSDADKEFLHVRLADESVASDRQIHLKLSEHPRIAQRSGDNGFDAIHPGYGFLSENYHFAEA
jgi:acetyl/propionyl-CoA carboxylase alpha subunit